MSLRLTPVEVPGPSGLLEGMVHADPEARPEWLAVVCHPHPLHGGTMHNKVVFRVTETLSELGLAVLRFNFRGVNLSAGRHDSGRGEQDDVRAALDFMAARFGALPFVVAGFSFGAAMALRVAPKDRRAAALLAVAPPMAGYEYSDASASEKPKVVVQGTGDELCPVEHLTPVYAGWAEPKRLFLVDGATHFFDRRLTELKSAVREGAGWALAQAAAKMR